MGPDAPRRTRVCNPPGAEKGNASWAAACKGEVEPALLWPEAVAELECRFADGASRTPHHQKLCDHPANPITRHGPPVVHLEVAVGCPAVARSQACRHPFVRPWGSAIGHWSRKQMFQLTMTFAG